MRKAIAIYVPLLAALFFTACRKDICYEENHPHNRPFRVIVDREYMGDAHPQMRIDFYSTDGDHHVRYVYAGRESVSLPVGRYRVVSFNDDSDFYQIENDGNCEGIKALMPEINRSQYNNLYGGRIMSSWSGPAVEEGIQEPQGPVRSVEPLAVSRTIGQPDDLFACSVPVFDITSDPALQQDLYLLPRNQTVTYVILTDIQGLQYARQYRGVMTGVAGDKYLYDLVRGSLTFTMMFDCSKTSPTSLSTVVTAFGINKPAIELHEANDNIITFEFLLMDNSVYRQSFDIYDYLDEDLCCNGGIIDLRGVPITIPATETTDGWNAKLEDWYEETIELE